jgi:signal transduction histidine kinase
MTPESPTHRKLLDKAIIRNNGIARRLMVALLLFSTLITAIITTVELYLDYRGDVRGIDERIESVRKVFLPTLTESVWVADRAQLQIQLDGLLNLGDIEYVGVVVDNETKWSAGERRSTRRIEKVIPMLRLDRGQMVDIGSLHVVGSVDNVLARLWSKLLVILVSNGIKTLLITVFVLLLFQLLVGQHLEHISAHLRGIGKDIRGAAPLHLRRPAAGRWRPDALDHVTNAVNTMQRDISLSQWKIQELNEELEGRVAERTRQLKEAKEAAELASAAKSQFLSRMSHELRTPLNAILGFSEVLQLDARAPLTPEQSLRVEQIRRSGGHLLLLIDDLLDVARIETGSLRLQIDDLDLLGAVGDVLAELKAPADARGVRIVVQVPAAGSCAVRGDATRMRQVLLNLVSNAIKYNRPGGSVTVTVGPLDARVRVSVADTGLGMDERQLKSLFEPFNRLGRQTSGVEGTGIGLVITKSLVELMGGELSVRSRPGEGSEFAFTLAPATGRGAASSPPNAGAAGVLRTDIAGRVLYIDDDEVNRLLMQAYFSLRPGVHLTLADSGRSGIAAALASSPDLILIDMVMPDMTGSQVLQEIRAHDALRATPCIAVSANAMPQEAHAALALGFEAYLTKPLPAGVLLAEIDRFL